MADKSVKKEKNPNVIKQMRLGSMSMTEMKGEFGNYWIISKSRMNRDTNQWVSTAVFMNKKDLAILPKLILGFKDNIEVATKEVLADGQQLDNVDGTDGTFESNTTEMYNALSK